MHFKEMFAFISLSLFGAFERFSEGACVLPWDGTWYDSAFPDNNVTFDTNTQTVEGWKVLVYNIEGTNWVCLEDGPADKQLLFKSLKNFGSLGLQDLYMFRCIRWNKLSDHVYQYYVYADEQTNIANQRLYVEATATNVTMDVACVATDPPTVREFHILIRAGTESSIQQNCPSLLLHNFTYVHDDGVMTSCEPTNGLADGCYSRSQIAFDFTACNASFGFSASGLFHCVHSETVGGIQYVVTVNPEAVDYVTTFKFTCFVLQQNGSYIYSSDSKGSCKRNQSPFSKDSGGTAFLKLLPFESCPFTQPSNESDTDDVIIAMAIISTVVVLVIIIVTVVCCCKKSMKGKSSLPTITSTNKEDEQPLNESIDEKVSTSDVTPETYSTDSTASSAKVMGIHQTKVASQKVTANSSNNCPSPEKETASKSCKKTKDSFLEVIVETEDSKTNNKTKESETDQDKDRLAIDYEHYLKNMKNGTKRKHKGKVDFLVDKEQLGDHNLQLYGYHNNVQKHEKGAVEDTAAMYNVSNSSTGNKLTSGVEELPQGKSVNIETSDESESFPNTTTNNLKWDEVMDSKRNPSHNLENEAVKIGTTSKANKTVVLQRQKLEKGRKNKLSKGNKNQQLKEDLFSDNDKISKLSNDNDQVNIDEKKTYTETQMEAEGGNRNSVARKDSVPECRGNIELFKASFSETPITRISPDHANQNMLNGFLSSDLQSNVGERGEKAIKNKKSSRKNEKSKIPQDSTESIHDNVGNVTNQGRKERKAKSGKVKKKPQNNADSLGTKVIKKRKSKEQTVVDDIEDVPVINDITESDLLSTAEEFCEMNSVNENQPTAVQAWACNSEEKGKNDTPSDKVIDTDRKSTQHEEESVPDVSEKSDGNKNDNLNNLNFKELLELRPASSLAPVSTLIREDTTSPLFQKERKPRENEINTGYAIPAMKSTALKVSEDSSSLTKVDESLPPLQVLDIEF